MIPRSLRSRMLRLAGSLLVLAAVFCIFIALRTCPARAALKNLATDRAVYSHDVAEHYNFHFGGGESFLPSNATTDTGQFIDSKTFLTAKYCGHCHQEAYAEWRQTAHANSFRAPWYLKNTNMLRDTKGIEYTRHCEGCHNPIALTSGALTKGSPSIANFDQGRRHLLSLPFDSEGGYAWHRQRASSRNQQLCSMPRGSRFTARSLTRRFLPISIAT